MNSINFSFFWEGQQRKAHFFTNDEPLDEVQISALVYGAIKLWFLNQNLPLPEVVRNIKIDDGEKYHWRTMKIK